MTIEYGWADNQINRLPALAAELVRRNVAVIVTGAPPAALAAKGATTTIPVVFGVAVDPVALGLVTSLARPGGNLTGIFFLAAELAAKRLELLRELVPAATRVAVLVNPANAETTESTLRDVAAAARTMGLQIKAFNASTSSEIDAAFATLVRERPDALFVAGDGFFLSRRVQLANLTVRHALPAAFSVRQYTANSASIPGASLRAPSLRTCRSFNRPSSNWSSMPRLPRCSASPCRSRCSLAPTK